MCQGNFKEQYCIEVVNCLVFHSFEVCVHFAGMVLGFNVVLPKSFHTFARQREVEVLTNRVIYRLLQHLKVRFVGVCVCAVENMHPCVYSNIYRALSVMRHSFQVHAVMADIGI